MASISEETTISRSCADLSDPFRQLLYGRQYYQDAIVRFLVDPVTVYQAVAHLELGDGLNRIVLAGRRGPKGGWSDLRVIRRTEQMPLGKAYVTYHLVVEES